MIVSSDLSDNKKSRLISFCLVMVVFLTLAAGIFMQLVVTKKVHFGDAKLRYQFGMIIFKIPYFKKTTEFIGLSAWREFQKSGFKSAQVSLIIKNSQTKWSQDLNINIDSLGGSMSPELFEQMMYTTESLTPIPSYKLIYKQQGPVDQMPNIHNLSVELWVDQSTGRAYQAVITFDRGDDKILVLAQPSTSPGQLTISDLLLLKPPAI